MTSRTVVVCSLAFLTIPWSDALAQGTANGNSAVESRFHDFFLYFEPDIASLLGSRLYDSRIPDLSEEGLAARIRGYRDLRTELGLREAEDTPLTQYLRQRVTQFDDFRPWSWAPSFYLEPVARSLWVIEESPDLPQTDRISLLTQRARQLPTALEAAEGTLLFPPRFLVGAGVRRTGELRRYVEHLLAFYRTLPEGGQKWGLERALTDLRAALEAHEEWLGTEALRASSTQTGVGERGISTLSVTYGLDGILHASEIARAVEAEARTALTEVERSVQASRSGSTLLSQSGRDEVTSIAVEAYRTLTGLGPDSAEPDISIVMGASASGEHMPLVSLAGRSTDEGGFPLSIYIAREGHFSSVSLNADLAIAVTWWHVWLSATDQGRDLRGTTIAQAQRLRAAVEWFLARRLADTQSSATRGGAVHLSFLSALTSRIVLDIHRHMVTAEEGSELLAREGLITLQTAEALVAEALAFPDQLFAPIVGYQLEERWLAEQQPPLVPFLVEVLRGGG